MKTRLMFRDKAFCLQGATHPFPQQLVSDLRLAPIFDAMAKGDEDVMNSVMVALLSPLTASDDIVYRQQVLQDCIHHEALIIELYQIAQEALAAKKKEGWWMGHYLPSIFSGSVRLLSSYLVFLKRLRRIASDSLSTFTSQGFLSLFQEVVEQMDDDFFTDAKSVLNELRLHKGVLLGCSLPPNVNAEQLRLLRPNFKKRWLWFDDFFARTYRLAPRDEVGTNDLMMREEIAMNNSINSLATAVDHVEHFFIDLRNELAFYLGNLHLTHLLADLKLPYCVPEVCPPIRWCRTFAQLYDLSFGVTGLPMTMNDLPITDKPVYLITGANQGGKTTYLRSIGQAQLFMQSGGVVPAASYSSHIAPGIFTHFTQDEDKQMQHGRLEDEMRRMNEIIDVMTPGALLLSNESFSSTNEVEGGDLFYWLVRALESTSREVLLVTHMYSLAEKLISSCKGHLLSLIAERTDSGVRTYVIQPGMPQPTAYGRELYQIVFNKELATGYSVKVAG